MGIANFDRVINPGIARIRQRSGDEYQGEVLIKETTKPVTLFARGNYDYIKQQINQQFPNCEIVSTQVYLCELDHINLFGVRSDAQCWTLRENHA